MTTYKSKIGLEFIIPISIIVIGTGILMVAGKSWIGLTIVVLVVAFVIHMLATTYYQVDNTTLKIRCGFFFDQSIKIETIKEIKETSNPISAPATSLERVVIRYNQFDTVIISPKEKEDFINHLRIINPGIKIVLKERDKQRLTTT